MLLLDAKAKVEHQRHYMKDLLYREASEVTTNFAKLISGKCQLAKQDLTKHIQNHTIVNNFKITSLTCSAMLLINYQNISTNVISKSCQKNH